MWPHLIDCLESDLSIKNKLSCLNTLINVHGLNLEVENEFNLVKNKVKAFCADATKRTEGLLLLYAAVHCNSVLYIDNWSQIVLGSLQCPDLYIPREIPLKVLNRMLINFGNELDYKDVFSKVISDILPIILDPEDDKLYKLSCQNLAISMKYIPEITGTRLADIEKMLLKELDNPYGEIVEAIGECFAALPMCVLHVQRSGSRDYRQIWCNIFTKFLNTMHSLLNNLMRLSGDQEGYVDVTGLPVFDIPSSEANNNVPVLQIDVFKSLCICMAKMMSSEKCSVHLPVTHLLDTLLRVYDMEKLIQGESRDATIGYLKLGFPQMLNGLYIVLEALILNFYIIQQTHNFVNLMTKSLNVMGETFSHSSVSQVRGSTWKLINIWLSHYGSKGSNEIASHKYILQEILADIDIESKQNNHEVNQRANEVFACIHALKVLKSLVETSNTYAEENSLNKVCPALIRNASILLIHRSKKRDFPFPYSDEKCRKMLFDALLTYAITDQPSHMAHIAEAERIFRNVSKYTDAKVDRICHKFRKLSRYFLNPKKPPPDQVRNGGPPVPNRDQPPSIENITNEWLNSMKWHNTNGPHSDDQMDDSEVAHVHRDNAYSDKVESESDLMPAEQIEENESHMNHEYRRIEKQSSQSVGEEESMDDSDIEPTYVSTDSNPQRIGLNDSSHINSFGVQSCVEQYATETRTERQVSETIVPNITNNVENNIEDHVSAFIEVKSAGQKPPQAPMGNGEWKKKENSVDSDDEDESDIEEEADEDGEVNEEVSDNAADEASDGKHSPEFDEERPTKRRKCLDEDLENDMFEGEEEEDFPENNQSSDEEGAEVNNIAEMEYNTGNNSENLNEEESQDGNEDIGCKSPTIREMCGDFVLAEPAATDTS